MIGGYSIRILIVDDEQIQIDSLTYLLKENISNCIILAAHNGYDGLRILRSNMVFDIVFVDILMPIISGLDMIEQFFNLRHNSQKTPKFIILSGCRDFEFARKAIPLGIIDYLLKPVEIPILKKLLLTLNIPKTKTLSLSIKNEDICYDNSFSHVIDYIHLHYMNDLSLDSLAKKLYFSNSYFGTLFKRKTGKSFAQYLHRVRLQHAEELLRNTDLQIHIISKLTGYNDVKYFIRVFKSEHSITPDDFRRKFRIEIL